MSPFRIVERSSASSVSSVSTGSPYFAGVADARTRKPPWGNDADAERYVTGIDEMNIHLVQAIVADVSAAPTVDLAKWLLQRPNGPGAAYSWQLVTLRVLRD